MITRRPRAGRLAAAAVALGAAAAASTQPAPRDGSPSGGVEFVFTSDAHYGLARSRFRGRTNVEANVVNAAIVAGINALPAMRFPNDGGIRAANWLDRSTSSRKVATS